MKKQFVVLGLGNFGASVAVTLQRLGCDVVAVDQDMARSYAHLNLWEITSHWPMKGFNEVRHCMSQESAFGSPARRAVLRGQRQRDSSLWTPFLRCGGNWNGNHRCCTLPCPPNGWRAGWVNTANLFIREYNLRVNAS